MTATVGHNNPPTPFEDIKEEIDNLYLEATNWCDGTEIENEAQAGEVNKLINAIRAAVKKADDLRKEENKPFDAGKAEVQERYNTLIGDTKKVTGKAVMALKAAKDTLTPWLLKLEEEKRAKEAEARAKEAAAQQAAEEARLFQVSNDLAAREETERLEKEADRARRAATAASNDTAKAKGGEGRASSLRTTYRAEVTDRTAFAKWIWTRRPDEMDEFLRVAADKFVAENHKRPIDGVTIHEERKAV